MMASTAAGACGTAGRKISRQVTRKMTRAGWLRYLCTLAQRPSLLYFSFLRKTWKTT